MRLKRGRAGTAFAALLVAVGAAACGSGDDTSGTAGTAAAGGSTAGAAASGEKVQLNYWDMQWGTPVVAQLKKNVAEFNASHPNIQVKFTELSWGDYMQKILSAVAAGKAPDVSGGDSGIAFNMDAQGQALDISDLYQKWESNGTLSDMIPWANQKWDYQGRRPGVSWQMDPRGIFYRKDLLAQAGIPVPKTWDELLAAAKKLTTANQIGIAIPGKQGSYDPDQFYMTLVFQAGGGLANENGDATIDTDAQRKALEFERELVRCCAAKGTASWTFTEVMKAFEQGKAAMAFGGGWFIGDIQKNAPKIFQNTGVLPVLVGPGGPQAQHSVAFANPWMIYKQSKHPAEAKIFLDWMMQKQNLTKIYQADPGGKWPVFKSVLQNPAYQSNDLIKTFGQELAEHGIDYWYPNNKAAVAIGSLGTSITDMIVNPVISGKRQPEDALKDAQGKLEPLFNKK